MTIDDDHSDAADRPDQPEGIAAQTRAAVEALSAARDGVVFSGAGMSTGSGIPDFRSPGGVWTRFDPREMTFERYATEPSVRADSWAMRREFLDANAQPNAAHHAVAALQSSGHVTTVVTQNIDGLHQAAGTTSVIELHGTAHTATCIGVAPRGGNPDGCGWTAPTTEVLATIDGGNPDPACPVCDGLVKAATISFGQSMDTTSIAASIEVVMASDILLVIGSSLLVWPAAGLVPRAAQRGIPIVIMNAEATEFDHLATAVLRDPVEDVLPGIVAGLPHT